MTNKLTIIQTDDTLRRRHGGIVEHVRTFVGCVNGVPVKTWADDAPPDYNSGKYLDEAKARWIEIWETALGCKAEYKEAPDRRIYPKV